jgi:hypothetical protein
MSMEVAVGKALKQSNRVSHAKQAHHGWAHL